MAEVSMPISPDNYGYWTWMNQCALQGGPSLEVELADGRKIIQKYQGNPAVMEDYFIVNALSRSPKARADFTRLFPTLDDVSQSRLTTLVRRNPVITRLMTAPTTLDDAIQHKEITAGVHVRAGGKPGIT
jgi:hypothetical protein